MKHDPVTLGINSAYHESSACILRGSRILAFAEEERFNRKKHAKLANVDNADELPTAAIRYCLKKAGVRADQVEHVAYSFDPELRQAFTGEAQAAGSWGTPEGERIFLASLRRVPRAVSALLDYDVRSRWVWVSHELAHAASAFLTSPFEEAAIISLDGIGEHATGVLGYGRGHSIEIAKAFPYPNSVGFVWEKLSKFIGLDEYSAPKMMALAPFASEEHFRADLESLLALDDSDLAVNAEEFRFRVEDYAPLERRFGPRRKAGEYINFRDAALAAALQAQTERVLLGLAQHMQRMTKSKNLCLAGGVALNCVAMGRMLAKGPFDGVFVQPLANDAGSALGAALWVAHSMGGVSERGPAMGGYIGPEFDEPTIERALAGSGLRATRIDKPASVAASAVADGLIVGWFSGPSEVGPRALGARSILGDPRRPGTKELINLKVKHREFFRPFAPSVLDTHASEWFSLPRRSHSTRFMSFAVDVAPDKRQLIPAVLHVDGTSRIQTVSKDDNPAYHALISEFHSLTGIPLVLNTSFNTFDEPIVLSPEDAIRTFLRTGLDLLVLQNFVVRRAEQELPRPS